MLSALRRRLRDERGFMMPVMLATIMVALILVATVLADVQGDFGPGRHDEDRRIAYAAAEAGVNDYLARLESNPSYWSKCTDPGNNPALGNPGTLNYVDVPGSGATPSQYAIELLPTAGYSACVVGNQASFVNAASEFKIRVTGRTSQTSQTHRTVVATFRPKGFLNYIYYTDYETQHPLLYEYSTDGRQTRSDVDGRDLVTWGAQECATRYWPARGTQSWSGSRSLNNGILLDTGWQSFSQQCGVISFGGGDKVSGPFHTNDQISLCGTAYFGRKPGDAVEVGGAPGWRQICTGGGPVVNMAGGTNPNVGTWKISARRDFPPSNATLHDDADPQYRFKGPTSITVNGAGMTVTGKREDGTVLTNASMPIPEGVVYVSDDASAGSCPGYRPLTPYNGSSSGAPAGNPSCGDLFIKGTYSQNVTFASGNDIVVTGNLQRTSDAWMLGLIPDKWARVYHPVNRNLSTGSCSATSGTITDVHIDAAILALTRSFTVDGYECGNGLGDLTIRGAIAQKYRGPVGTSGGTTGFIKDYQYDNRLAQRSPPRFMNPVQPAWALANQTEQIPAQ
jgi:hypothetical protein